MLIGRDGYVHAEQPGRRSERHGQKSPKSFTIYTKAVAEVCLTCDKPDCSGEWMCYAKRRNKLRKKKK